MESPITLDNLYLFAYTNLSHLRREDIRGIALSFTGFNCAVYRVGQPEPEDEPFYSEHGILFVEPCYNPWSWMSENTVYFVEEIVSLLRRELDLPASRVPLISTGGSMGGYSAIMFSYYARLERPVAVVANCPVCDLVATRRELPETERAFYTTYGCIPGREDDILASRSPVNLVPRMPRVPYSIYHCSADPSVPKKTHSDRFVPLMLAEGHELTYHEVPDRGHCDLTPEMWDKYRNYIVTFTERFGRG